IVQSKGIAADITEHAPPNHWGGRQVFSAGPFVSRKGHRAVLNADFHAMVLCKRNQRLPCFKKAWPIFVHSLCPITPDEGIHILEPEFRRGPDALLKVVHAAPRDFGIGIQWVWIVAQAG